MATVRYVQTIELKVSLFVPLENTAGRLMVELADAVNQRSGGRLTLKLFPSETLGPTKDQYDLARTGVADIAYVMHSTMPGRFPLTELATLPFVLPDPICGTAALLELLPRYLAREHDGVRVLFLAANAPLAVHSQVPLRSIEDFKGRRIRVPGGGAAATLVALNAVPVFVLPLDVPEALRKGAVDGAAMTYQGAAFSRLAGLVKYSTPLNANTVTFGLVMNPESYERLPSDLRTVVDEVLGGSAGLRLARKLEHDAAAGREYMREGGVTIIEPDAREREALDAAIRPVISQAITALDAESLPAREVYDAMKAEVARALHR